MVMNEDRGEGTGEPTLHLGLQTQEELFTESCQKKGEALTLWNLWLIRDGGRNSHKLGPLHLIPAGL